MFAFGALNEVSVSGFAMKSMLLKKISETTYHYIVSKYVGMRSPHVRSSVLVESLFRRRIDVLQSSLRIGTQSYSSADLDERRRGFVDMDIDVRIVEETDCEGQATNASADDCDAECLGV